VRFVLSCLCPAHVESGEQAEQPSASPCPLPLPTHVSTTLSSASTVSANPEKTPGLLSKQHVSTNTPTTRQPVLFSSGCI
jgi:hypothetical protein